MHLDCRHPNDTLQESNDPVMHVTNGSSAFVELLLGPVAPLRPVDGLTFYILVINQTDGLVRQSLV